jgi:nucleoid-associated protein YgaU
MMEKADNPQAPKKQGFNFDPKKSGTVKSYTVKAGDTLSVIAEKIYGDAAKFEVIFEANKDILKSANDIKVGQELKIPPKK